MRIFFVNLDHDDIQRKFSSKTFYKGLEYYEGGRVSDVAIYGANRLEARVDGNRRYVVSLELNNDILRDDCSCPIGGLCKHVVSVLLFCVDNFEVLKDQGVHVLEVDEHKKIQQYLNGSSKPDLIDLVMEFAPQSFKDQLAFSTLDSDQSKAGFLAGKIRIEYKRRRNLMSEISGI